MKQIVFLIIVAFGVINFGCDKCECDENTDEYYIKYAVGVESGRVSNVPIDMVIRNEHDEMTPYSDTDAWTITLGPVKKGFTALISVGIDQNNWFGDAILLPKIYISKNDSPFALKASGESDDLSEPLEIEYTIDF